MKFLSDPVAILRRLVAIPSYVDVGHNEAKAAEFVLELLSRFPSLSVSKQKVAGRRFNVLAETKKNTGKHILFAGHLDTVQPKLGWETDQFSLVKRKGALYGLGALDMKGGIAAMLAAYASLKDPQNLKFLFYCDEEYDFAGMKMFLKLHPKHADYKLAVFGEPSDLKIMNAHRGLIEISFSVMGKAGHAANPHGGISAIDGAHAMLVDLRHWLRSFRHPKLGSPSLNIAYVRGGLLLSERSKALGRQGNNIPDFCEAVVDIRTTSPSLCAQNVIHRLEQEAKRHRVVVRGMAVRHDLGSLYTPKHDLAKIEKIVAHYTGSKDPYLDPAGRGYGDGQMLQQKLGIPVISIGPRGVGMHGAGEAVEQESLYACRDVYASIMESVGQQLHN